jgi:hypothetical protein
LGVFNRILAELAAQGSNSDRLMIDAPKPSSPPSHSPQRFTFGSIKGC